MRIHGVVSACLLAVLPWLADDLAAQPATMPAGAPPVLSDTTTPGGRRDVRSMADVRKDRTQTEEGGRTLIREPGRLIVRDGDRLSIRHDDTFRMRPGARDTKVEQQGEKKATTVVRQDGTRVISVVGPDETLLRRARIDRQGKEVVLLDSMRASGGAKAAPAPARDAVRRVVVLADDADPAAIEEVLTAEPVAAVERPFALDDIRGSVALRDRMPSLDIETLSFAADSWDLAPGEVRQLQPVAEVLIKAIRRNPAEFFLIEAHTDVEGAAIDNLSLSDRRAEAVAMLLTRAFGVPPENLATQGYGEQFPKVDANEPAIENHRISIRRITPLLAGTSQAGR